MTPCSPEELAAFVAAYPRKLVRDVFGACEPSLVTFNDFTLGNWPESVVASYFDCCSPGAPSPWGDPPSGHKILTPLPGK